MPSPQPGDKILIVKQPWMDMVLLGQKKLEIRALPYSSGNYWLGRKSCIYGLARLGRAIPISTVTDWHALRPRHRVESQTLPYRKTFGLPILRAVAVAPMPYLHPRGAISLVKYRPRPAWTSLFRHAS